jgi:hypothetical protein
VKKNKSPLRLNFLRNKKLLMRQKSFEESIENLTETVAKATAVKTIKAKQQSPNTKYDEDDAYDDDEQITTTEDFPQLIQAANFPQACENSKKSKTSEQRHAIKRILNLK